MRERVHIFLVPRHGINEKSCGTSKRARGAWFPADLCYLNFQGFHKAEGCVLPLHLPKDGSIPEELAPAPRFSKGGAPGRVFRLNETEQNHLGRAGGHGVSNRETQGEEPAPLENSWWSASPHEDGSPFPRCPGPTVRGRTGMWKVTLGKPCRRSSRNCPSLPEEGVRDGPDPQSDMAWWW